MARKRTSQRGTKVPAENTAGAGVEDSKPIAFTLEQALAELDRLTPWTRSLPICNALLTNEINRLRADGNEAGADKSSAPEASCVSAPRPVPAAPSGPLSRESSADDKASISSDAAQSDAGAGKSDPAEKSSHETPIATAECTQAASEVESACPDHWDSEEEASAESTYLDGSIDGPAAEEAAKPDVEKIQLKIRIPIEEYPGYNFIGRLLGPRGATLKHLEVSSRCRLYIRGRGSLRSSDMSHEFAKASLPGFEHLNEDLHVLVEYEGPSTEREKCLSIASSLVAPLLVPPASDEQDELKKQQLKELAILNGTYKENKQLLPVANKRIAPGSGPGSSNSNTMGTNSMGASNNDINQQQSQNGGAGGNGMGPNVMMQVMAQQMFLQEQHKLNMRLGMQQAQHAMAARQQAMSTNAMSTNAMSTNAMSTNAMSTNAMSTNAMSTNAMSTNATTHTNNNPNLTNNTNLSNNATFSTTNINGAFSTKNNNSKCSFSTKNNNANINTTFATNNNNTNINTTFATNNNAGNFANNAKLNNNMAATANAMAQKAMHRNAFGSLPPANGTNGNMGGGDAIIHVRGRSNQVMLNTNRAGVVSVDAKAFVPPVQRPSIDAQPFVPTHMSHQQHERGRSNSQGAPHQRTYSQGPVQHQTQHQTHLNNGHGDNARTPSKGRGFDMSSRDENLDPQQHQWGLSSMGMTKPPSSPSFLTCMPSTPHNGQTPPQYLHQNAHYNNHYHNNLSRCDSYTGHSSSGLDDSVDKGWGSSLPFDLGWEAGDGDSSINTSMTAKNGSAVRNSPPGGRAAAQRWHPYTRSPPKSSPDFNSKVMAICNQSFGGQTAKGFGGGYSLF